MFYKMHRIIKTERMKLMCSAGIRYFSLLQYSRLGLRPNLLPILQVIRVLSLKVKQSGHEVDLVLRLRVSGAVSLLLLYAFMVWRRTMLIFYSLENFFKNTEISTEEWTVVCPRTANGVVRSAACGTTFV
jgi:hypothetical protein